MTVLLVAHGTRNPHGVAMIGDLAASMAMNLGEPVKAAFVDVLGPTPSQVLARLPENDHIALVPAFLSSGYHVRRDIPEHVRLSGHRRVRVSDPLGPSAELVCALVTRLAEADARPDDAVVFAAAGSSDPHAVADIQATARRLSVLRGAPVRVAFAAPPAGSGHPSVADAVTELRATYGGRVAVASYLLADGLFQQRLEDSGADVVARPIGLHDRVIDLACRRALSVQPLVQAARV